MTSYNDLAEDLAEELGTSALDDRLRIIERMASANLDTSEPSVDAFLQLLTDELD